MSDLPTKRSEMETAPRSQRGPGEDDLYTHVDYMGRAGESEHEKAVREGINHFGRALENMQKIDSVNRGAPASSPTPVGAKNFFDPDE